MITSALELQYEIRRAERLVDMLGKRVSHDGDILGPAGARLDADELIAIAEQIRSYLGTR